MPQRRRRSDCPIHFALETFGDRWTLLVLRDLLLKGRSSYSEFLGAEERIATNILADRLARLQQDGLVVHEAEPRHWFDDAAMARGSEREKRLMFQQAREQTVPYRSRMRTFAQGEVLPGVTAVPIPGHTPGHTGYLIESGRERLLIWGDVVHMPEVQVPRPEVSMVVDTDPEAAAESRRRVFDMVASERMLVTGMHLHFPGFAHVVREGSGYRLVPEAWRQAM